MKNFVDLSGVSVLGTALGVTYGYIAMIEMYKDNIFLTPSVIDTFSISLVYGAIGAVVTPIVCLVLFDILNKNNADKTMQVGLFLALSAISAILGGYLGNAYVSFESLGIDRISGTFNCLSLGAITGTVASAGVLSI